MMQSYIPVIFFIVLLACILYGFLFMGSVPFVSIGSTVTQSAPLILCTNGVEKPCFGDGNCAGTRTCKSGVWGSCMIPHVCIPATKVPCVEHFCSVGYKICNACGTGFDACIYTNSGRENNGT